MSRAARGLVVGFALFALYATTASGDVGWEDSAFFQLCHAVLGVPHGPGFPLYVLLGRLFVWPFAAASTLGSTLFTGLALACAGVVLLEVMLLLDSPSEESPAAGLRHWTTFGAAAVVAGWATLSVNTQQAARTEVYGLALLLVLLTCYCALRSKGEVASAQSSWQFACAAAWSWGLAMAVHPLIAVAGATPWLVYAAWKFRSSAKSAVLTVCAAFPLSLYLFPVLRGRIPGVWAWGDFTNFSSIADYFTRRSSWEAVASQDGGLLENLAGWGFGFDQLWPTALWIPTLLALWLLRKQWAYLLSLVCLFVLVLWAAPYDPANLDLLGYFLPAIAFLAAGAGVLAQRCMNFLWMQMPGLSGRSRLALGFFLVCLAGSWPTAALLSAEDQRVCGSDAGVISSALGASLPKGATLLVSEDNFLGMLEFESRTRNFRPDLQVISVGALRLPFYRRSKSAQLPSDWVSGWDFTETWNQKRWEQEVRSLLSRYRTGDAWFAQFERLPGIAQEHVSPYGFVQALSGDTSQAAWAEGLDFWKDQVQAGGFHGPARDALGRWIFNFGVVAMDRGRISVGWEAMLLAVAQSPEDPEIYFLLGQALARAGRTPESRAMLAAALELAPYRVRYREALESVCANLVAVP